MKKNRIVWILIGLLAAYQGVSQDKKKDRFPDSLTISTSFNSEIEFAFKEMALKKAYITNDLWKSMLSIMETAISNTTLEDALVVTYELRKVEGEEKVYVKVKEAENKADLLIIDQQGTKQLKANRTSFEILLPEVNVYFSVENNEEMNAIKSMDIESVWEGVNAKYSNEGKRNYYIGEGELKYDKAVISKIEDVNGRLEHMDITFIGVGLGYYRDRFIPDFSSKIGFNLYDKFGDPFISFGFTYTFQYLFEQNELGKFDHDINGWLSGFAKWRPGGDYEVGVGIGSLVQKEGDFYNGDTWKFTVYNKSAKSKVSFAPELVFTDNFKSFFPAMRFGFTF